MSSLESQNDHRTVEEDAYIHGKEEENIAIWE